MSSEIPPRSDAEADETPSAEFAKALEAFERQPEASPAAQPAAEPPRVGAAVHGTVVSLTDTHALIDIGGRSEAIADLAHFRNEDGTLRVEVGAGVDLFVAEAGEQIVLAPSVKTRASSKANLERFRAAREAGMPVSGRVTTVNAGGLQVDLGGARGFCPMSQIERGHCADPSVYVGRTLEFVVVSVEDARRSVVLSRRAILKREEAVAGAARLAALQVGDEVEGTVRRLEGFGAFVDLGGLDGMVHVSEISHTRVAHPKDAVREGEKVKARVLRIETGKDGRPKIALSIKAAMPDPWGGIAARFTPGARVQGRVARLTDFGAFVTLESGIDGLVHVSQIAARRIEHPRDALTVGQEIEAVILAVEPEKHRISLSIRATLEPEGSAEARPPREGRGRGEGRPERGERGDRPRRRDGGRDRDRDRDRDRSGPIVISTPSPAGELTTMAIALRKAEEEARRKRERSSQ